MYMKIYRLLYSIYMVFTGSFIRFTWFLQAPLFDLHDIYRLLYSIYMIFTGAFIRFIWFLQAPLFDLHGIYRLFYSTYITNQTLLATKNYLGIPQRYVSLRHVSLREAQ